LALLLFLLGLGVWRARRGGKAAGGGGNRGGGGQGGGVEAIFSVGRGAAQNRPGPVRGGGGGSYFFTNFGDFGFLPRYSTGPPRSSGPEREGLTGRGGGEGFVRFVVFRGGRFFFLGPGIWGTQNPPRGPFPNPREVGPPGGGAKGGSFSGGSFGGRAHLGGLPGFWAGGGAPLLAFRAFQPAGGPASGGQHHGGHGGRARFFIPPTGFFNPGLSGVPGATPHWEGVLRKGLTNV